ncbi:MAG: glutamine--fructose-6-phosphate aminotransferase, partial [Planctomycetales bacterium]|nr:glutamine--fructose-6-phosphate aminotransferase [Planctomycetales bacterium]
MCGIVGYVGNRPAVSFLLEGLRRLEYRGYDSAGVATANGQAKFHVVKTVGRVEALAERIARSTPPGNVGIGHTRWATHGVPSDNNAHPHAGGHGPAVTLVHNGVIENYAKLKEFL